MELDFNRLSQSQVDLIIDRLCNKFNVDIGIDTFALIIKTYRIKKYEQESIILVNSDEVLLKGNTIKVVKSRPKKIDEEKEDLGTLEEPIEEVMEEIKEENHEEMGNSLIENMRKLNRLRTSSSYESNENYSNETKNRDIILDNNIEQIESEFSLGEINSKLPSESLLDKYNFGYFGLFDDEKENPFAERLKKT